MAQYTINTLILNCDSCEATLMEFKNKDTELERGILESTKFGRVQD